jgi:hypothetical protein
MLHKKDGKKLGKPFAHRIDSASKHFVRNKPMVNLRIGRIAGHLFYPAGKPEDVSNGVAKGLQ